MKKQLFRPMTIISMVLVLAVGLILGAAILQSSGAGI